MDYVDSVRRAVRQYPGGVDAVAARLGKSSATLDKELRRSPGFKLGADDAAEISVMAYDLGLPVGRDYPNALAAAHGCALLPLPLASAGEVTAEMVASVMRECADLVTEVSQTLADGQVSANEMRRVEARWAELMAAGQVLMGDMAARHKGTMGRWLAPGAEQ